MMRETPKCFTSLNQTNTHVTWFPCWKSRATCLSSQSISWKGKKSKQKNDKAHNSGPPNYLPKTTLNGILTKNYSLSFCFFNLGSFLCMVPPSWRSALSVAKDRARGGGTDTSCPSGPGMTSTRSTASTTSGASGADS